MLLLLLSHGMFFFVVVVVVAIFIVTGPDEEASMKNSVKIVVGSVPKLESYGTSRLIVADVNVDTTGM